MTPRNVKGCAAQRVCPSRPSACLPVSASVPNTALWKERVGRTPLLSATSREGSRDRPAASGACCRVGLLISASCAAASLLISANHISHMWTSLRIAAFRGGLGSGGSAAARLPGLAASGRIGGRQYHGVRCPGTIAAEWCARFWPLQRHRDWRVGSGTGVAHTSQNQRKTCPAGAGRYFSCGGTAGLVRGEIDQSGAVATMVRTSQRA